MLGSRVPVSALVDTVRRLRPRRLVLSAQLPQTADESILASLPDLRPAMVTLLCRARLGPDGAGASRDAG